VNEVKLNDSSQSAVNVEFSAADSNVTEDNDDKDWVSLNEAGENLGPPHDGNQPQTISEQIAQVSTSNPYSINS